MSVIQENYRTKYKDGIFNLIIKLIQSDLSEGKKKSLSKISWHKNLKIFNMLGKEFAIIKFFFLLFLDKVKRKSDMQMLLMLKYVFLFLMRYTLTVYIYDFLPSYKMLMSTKKIF